jgi:hypothetical protein
VLGYPLSSRQRYLVGSGGSWSSQLRYRLEGAIDSATLAHSVSRCATPHVLLRTKLLQVAGIKHPVQVVHSEPIDLETYTGASEPVALVRIEEEEQRKVGEQGRGPCCTVRLVMSSPGSTALILTANARCADRRSLEILARTVLEVYSAGVSAPEEGRGISYFQFAEWQRQRQLSDAGRVNAKFWNSVRMTPRPGLLVRRSPESSGKRGDAVLGSAAWQNERQCDSVLRMGSFGTWPSGVGIVNRPLLSDSATCDRVWE